MFGNEREKKKIKMEQTGEFSVNNSLLFFWIVHKFTQRDFKLMANLSLSRKSSSALSFGIINSINCLGYNSLNSEIFFSAQNNQNLLNKLNLKNKLSRHNRNTKCWNSTQNVKYIIKNVK